MTDYINVRDKAGFTALHHAAKAPGDNYEIVGELICRDADPNLKANDGSTPLSLAMDKENRGVFSLLLTEENIDLDVLDSQGNTPLHRAAEWLNLEEFSELLLRRNWDLNETNDQGQNALMLASIAGNMEVVRELESRMQEAEEDRNAINTMMQEALRSGDLPVIQKLITDGVPLQDYHDDHKMNILQAAICQNQVEIVEYLLRLPGRPVTIDATLDYVVHSWDIDPDKHIIQPRETNTLEHLNRMGHRIKKEHLANALHMAILAGSSRMVETVLSETPEWQCRDLCNRHLDGFLLRGALPPLDLAQMKEVHHQEIVDLLLKHGADPKVKPILKSIQKGLSNLL